MLICSASVSNGPLAQLVERGARNRKVLCSRFILTRLIRTRFHFLFGLLSLFKSFRYIHCIKHVYLFDICIEWSDSLVDRAWCDLSQGPVFEIHTG